MKNWILLSLAALMLMSCSLDDQLESSISRDDILNDRDFKALTELTGQIMDGRMITSLSIENQLVTLILSLDAKFVSGRTPADLDLFRKVYQEEVLSHDTDRWPLIQFETAHDVTAPIDQVWFALQDVASYPEWNPFTPMVETTFEIGSPILMHVRLFRNLPDLLFPVTEEVVEFEENDRMCWVSVLGSEFWMRSYRCYVVEHVSEDETILRSTMQYEGLLAPLTNFVSRPSVFDGFNDVAGAVQALLE